MFIWSCMNLSRFSEIFIIENCHSDFKFTRESVIHCRTFSSYDVRKGSFIAVDACHWTLCVTISVIDSWLCRTEVSKFGGERDRVVCSLSARIQCTWDSPLTGTCRMCIRCFLSARKFYATSGVSPFYTLRTTRAISLRALEFIFTMDIYFQDISSVFLYSFNSARLNFYLLSLLIVTCRWSDLTCFIIRIMSIFFFKLLIL